MRRIFLPTFFVCIINLLSIQATNAQVHEGAWSLEMCINQALQQNIQVQKAILSNEKNNINTLQAKAQRFPSVSASASQNLNWGRKLDSTNAYGDYSRTDNTSFGVSSSVSLYDGFKIRNSIKQLELNYKAGQFDIETIKEDISLSVVEAYLQILYAAEQVKNSEQQIKSTLEQLRLAQERFLLGAISKADLQQVKSELANENLTLANASNLLVLSKVSLMQLMELPLDPDFEIVVPEIDSLINENRIINTDSVYQIALNIKPQIKNASLNLESSKLDIKIAEAGYHPNLMLNGGINSGYSSNTAGLDFNTQVNDRLNPYVGLSLSVPIYQNRKIKSNVEIAKINVHTAELVYINEQNNLRKTIEQVCIDVIAAQKEFEASYEQLSATSESFALISEKYNQGLSSSVDYLFERTKQISAESSFLQSKYNLIFRYKILDFYLGTPITL